jgi:hypothetical protein
MVSSSRIFYMYLACCALGLLAFAATSTGLDRRALAQESVQGYLVDSLCVKEEGTQLAELGPKHTKKCLQMPACRQSGYALLLPASHDVLHFDQHGNDLVIKLVAAHHLESGWLLRATGKRTGDQFAVATLDLVSKSTPARRKN